MCEPKLHQNQKKTRATAELRVHLVRIMQRIEGTTKKETKVVSLKLFNRTVASDSGSGAVSGHVVGYSLRILHEVDQPPNHVRLIKRLVHLLLLIFSPERTCARKTVVGVASWSQMGACGFFMALYSTYLAVLQQLMGLPMTSDWR
jgi:hypothetical protein